jgi:hypothetical protein
MQPIEWRAEMLVSIERAQRNLREAREALYAARRASDILAAHGEGETMISDWLDATFEAPGQMQRVINRLKEVGK